MMCAVAGAINNRFARSASSMRPGRQLSFSSKKLVVTGFFESVCNVRGEINSVASRVITAKTSWPCLTSKLASSADLYAAIEPVTPSTTDFEPGRIRTTFRPLPLSRFLLGLCLLRSFLDTTQAQIPLCIQDLPEPLQIFLHRSTYNSIAIVSPMFHFPGSGG